MDIAIMAALLGAAICMGLGSLSNGAGIGYVVTGALRGWARQPSFSPALFRLMLVGQAGASTPSIFALVVALILVIKMASPDGAAADSWAQAAAYLSAGLCLGFGSLGSGIGCGLVGSDAVEAAGRNSRRSGKIMVYMLVGQAWSQTPNILALVIGLMLVFGSFGDVTGIETIGMVGRLTAVGICMGIGTIGPAVGIGFVGAKFCRALADSPEHGDGMLRNTFFVGAAVAESTTVYAFVIALLLLFGA
jgi:ATP synthase F0 subunit c